MTFLWFLIWFVWDQVGDREPLLANPVNFWLGALIFAVAVDLAGAHATEARRR